MNLLIVSATHVEIQGLIDRFNFNALNNNTFKVTNVNNSITILISGIGLALASYTITKHLSFNKYDLIINSGICGSFHYYLKPGELVNIVSEQFGDLGVDDNGIFKTFFDINILNKNQPPFNDGILINETEIDFFPEIKKIKNAKSITVNTASGFDKNIEKLITKFAPDVENMEGAVFFYICKNENLPFFEIRAVSNYVENRNRSNWKFDLAINILNNFLISLVEKLEFDKK